MLLLYYFVFPHFLDRCYSVDFDQIILITYHTSPVYLIGVQCSLSLWALPGGWQKNQKNSKHGHQYCPVQLYSFISVILIVCLRYPRQNWHRLHWMVQNGECLDWSVVFADCWGASRQLEHEGRSVTDACYTSPSKCRHSPAAQLWSMGSTYHQPTVPHCR